MLESFDAGERRMRLLVGGQLKEFSLAGCARSITVSATAACRCARAAWIGGELVDFRAEGDVIPMLIYRINFANPAADRYSRLALWQVHKTKAELDTAFRPLKIGDFSDLRVIRARPLRASRQHRDHRHRRPGPCPRASTAHAAPLRDSLFSYDVERNARRPVVGATFFGRGWGHGVGMCQVGAYGMALAGATYRRDFEEGTNTGIELQKLDRPVSNAHPHIHDHETTVVTRDRRWHYLPGRCAPLPRTRAAGGAVPGYLVRRNVRDDRRHADHAARARPGIRKSAVTMFALTFLAYNFKFLWAPLVDTVRHSAARPLRPAPLVVVRRPACLLMVTVVLLGSLDPTARP